MTVRAAPSLPPEVAARTGGTGALGAPAALSRREATLRSAATTCLAGIALVQAIGLPSLLAQGGQFAVLSLAAVGLCLGLGLALAAAPGGAAGQLWRVVAVAAVLLLAGWAAPHALAVPGLAGARGRWTAMPGAAGGALAIACLALALTALGPRRPSVRALATAAAVVLALGPGAATLLVALGPGPAGGEAAVAAGHVHAHASFNGEADIRFRPGSGRSGGHFVVRVSTPPQRTTAGIALVVAAALVFVHGAVGYLRRRVEPA